MKKFTILALCGALLFNTHEQKAVSGRDIKNWIMESTAVALTIAQLSVILYILKDNLIGSWSWYRKGTIKENFKSVGGNEVAKDELFDIVQYLKDNTKYNEMGAVIPKGVLFEGPPGTGKTLLARALAGEANCTFITACGADFETGIVGSGAKKVRSLFRLARLCGPCIIFIDEIDTLIKKRGSVGWDDGQTLNAFLAEVDGFTKSKHPIVIIGATNRADLADPAAVRPGRFDRIVRVGLPTVKDRENILNLHAQKKKCAAAIDLSIIARKTIGFSGAQLANLINEAAIIAINKNKNLIDQSDLESACDKVIMGSANKGLMISPEEKMITAYHEAGHTLIHILVNPTDATLHKVSVISRGNTGGHTAFLPKEKTCYSKNDFMNSICIGLGGRAAEYVVYNTEMVGSSSDLQQATHMAHAMICDYGMSDLGLVQYSSYAHGSQQSIDAVLKTLLDQCYQKACNLLITNRQKLDVIAYALFEKEELSAAEIYALIA